MKNWHSGPILIVGIMALLSSPGRAEVETTWHREAEPSRYATLDLITSGEPQGVKKLFGARVDEIVRSEIEDRLKEMGYTKSPDGEIPDFRLQYDASSAEGYVREVPQRELLPFNADDWVAPQFEALRSSFFKGTLILTVRDGATDDPVWCGWTTEPLKRRKLERRMRKLIGRILSQYPPEAQHQGSQE